MGNFLFKIKGKIMPSIFWGILTFVLGVGFALLLYSGWASSGIVTKIVLGLLSPISLWYSWSRILVILKNKISFYENGIEIQDGMTQNVVMLSEIKSYKVEESSIFSITFNMKDGKEISINSDDYRNLKSSIDKYSQITGFEFRTNF